MYCKIWRSLSTIDIIFVGISYPFIAIKSQTSLNLKPLHVRIFHCFPDTTQHLRSNMVQRFVDINEIVVFN